MRTIRLIVEYDGSDFSGWQAQSGATTVQGCLEEALERLCLEPIRVRGASRTDAGVHARGQVVAFEAQRSNISLIGFERGLRGFLPDQISIRSAEQVEPGWDPRRTSRGKRYRYTFWSDRNPSALDRQRAWFVHRPLNAEAMQIAASALVGTYDFEAFRAAGCVAQHAVRTIYGISFRQAQYNRLEMDVLGNAFVRNMVRIIAGTLAEVGLGRKSPAWVAEALVSKKRSCAGPTAPPHGLCLEEVIYDDRLPPRPKDNTHLQQPSQHHPSARQFSDKVE